MKRQSSILIAALIISAAATACQKTKNYDATGIFEATTVTVSSEIPGRLLTLAPDEGDTVTVGQLLGEVDTATLTLQQMQAESQQRGVESNLPDVAAQTAPLRAQLEHAQSEAARVRKLYADKAATEKQLADAEAQVTLLRSQLDNLMTSLTKSRSSLTDNASAIRYQREQIDAQIAKSRIISPLTGTVIAKLAQPGEFAQVGKPLYRIADLRNIYLRAYFTVEQLADIKLGDKVTVLADFGADKQYEYPGRIVWIAQESEFTPKSIQTPDSRASLVYAAKIAVTNDGRLKLGQYGEVRLNASAKQ